MFIVVNRKYKWVYIGLPKTGSESISRILTSDPFLGTRREMTQLNIKEWMKRHSRYNIVISFKNPYTRAVSLYKQGIRDGQFQFQFSDFCSKLATKLPTDYTKPISSFIKELGIKRFEILRIEYLQYDLKRLIESRYIGLRTKCPVKLDNPVYATSFSSKLDLYYNKDTENNVKTGFIKDFETAKYDKELCLAETFV